MKNKPKYISLLIIIITILTNVLSFAEAGKKGDIYVIPIKGDITKTSYKFLEKNINDIMKKEPSGIIFEIDTYGGLVDEAIKIKDLIISLDVDTVSFINNKAESAGVLISIASKNIVMSKTATIGSAETIPLTEKILSMWRGVLRDTAQHRGRDPIIIESMADKDIEIDGVVEKGKILNLTSKEALDLGISDLSSDSYEDIIKTFKLGTGELIFIEETLAIELSKHISSPYLSSFLISIGLIGIVIEVLTAGFGIGTSISVLAFGLYFGGNIMAGYTNFITLSIFITGMILLLIELIVPGFGLPGISGIIMVVLSLVFAAESISIAVPTIILSIIIAVVVGLILIKIGFKSKKLNKVVLNKKLNSEEKYISTDNYEEYLGKEGITITKLRPSGFAKIDGEKLDVLSDDGYIQENEEIKVIKVEGSKIFVRRM